MEASEAQPVDDLQEDIRRAKGATPEVMRAVKYNTRPLTPEEEESVISLYKLWVITKVKPGWRDRPTQDEVRYDMQHILKGKSVT